MANHNHPNWTGKPYRSTDEAYGGKYVPPKEESPLWWALGVFLLVVLVVLALFVY